MKTDASGNVILTSVYSHTVTKFNASGQVMWVLSPPLNQSGNLLVDATGNVYVNGTGYDTTASNLAVQKISSAGTVVWTKNFKIGAVSEHMSGGPMAIGANGSLYVLGVAGNSSAAYPETLVRINATSGAELNRRSLGNSADGTQGLGDTSLTVDASSNVFLGDPKGLIGMPPDLKHQTWSWSNRWPVRAVVVDRGNVYATGTRGDGNGNWYMYIARVKASTGANVSAPYVFGAQSKSVDYAVSGFASNTYGGNAIAVDGSGNIYAVGSGNDNPDTGGLVAKFNASNGALAWVRKLGFEYSATCAALAVDAHSNVYAGCTDNTFGTGQSTAMGLVYNSAGTELLYLSGNGPGDDDDIFDGIALGKAGHFFFLDESSYPIDPLSMTRAVAPTIFGYSASGL